MTPAFDVGGEAGVTDIGPDLNAHRACAPHAHVRSMIVAAELTDPEAGTFAPCPCGGCRRGTLPMGTAPYWHARRGPAPLLDGLMRSSDRIGVLHGSLRLPSWVDHAYRLRLTDGRWRYVAEPYALDDEAFGDLAHLSANGFEVTVTAWRARHYPGHTVAVEITLLSATESQDPGVPRGTGTTGADR